MKTCAIACPEAKGERFKVELLFGESLTGLNRRLSHPRSRQYFLIDLTSLTLHPTIKECLARNAEFKTWECTEEKMKSTRGGKALYMHCLPADISGVSCESAEVAAAVFDLYRVPTYVQASFKPYIIAAVMLTSRFEDPVNLLKALKLRAVPRFGL